MNNPTPALSEEAQHSNPQDTPAAQVQALFATHWPELASAAAESRWLSAPHHAEAFLHEACPWLRLGRPVPQLDPALQNALEVFGANQAAWTELLAGAVGRARHAADQASLQQLCAALDQLVQAAQQQAEAPVAQAITETQDSAPFGYFRREKVRGRLVQCRSTDAGSMPLFMDPQLADLPIAVAPKVLQPTSAAYHLKQAWQAFTGYLAELVRVADTGVAEASRTQEDEDYRYSRPAG
jgi:hypothetical protein